MLGMLTFNVGAGHVHTLQQFDGWNVVTHNTTVDQSIHLKRRD